MRCIAHVSDLHILADPVRGGDRDGLVTRFLNWGRAPDPKRRAARLRRALAAVRSSGADHVVLSGDLTETGHLAEYEHLAEILHEAALDPEHVTLVPGNHDKYAGADAWRHAITGPLAAFAASSACDVRDGGKLVERGDAVVLPVDSAIFQSVAFSSGQFSSGARAAIGARLRDRSFRDKAFVLVLHHPPAERRMPIVDFMDGLRGDADLVDLLARHPRLHVLHGHLHRASDRSVDATSPPRVFGATATCDDRDGAAPRLRLYRIDDGALTPTALPPAGAPETSAA